MEEVTTPRRTGADGILADVSHREYLIGLAGVNQT